MQVEPVTPRCAALWREGADIILGISPFNSYFSGDRIRQWLRWGEAQAGRLYLYVPDGPSRHTLRALGYGPDKAERKARRQARWLKNKLNAAAAEVGMEINGQLLDSAALDANSAYTERVAACRKRYAQDACFRKSCLDTSRRILAAHAQRGSSLVEDAENIAVEYFLEELPMFLAGRAIVGGSSALFVYRECPEFVRHLLIEPDPSICDRRQGFGELVESS